VILTAFSEGFPYSPAVSLIDLFSRQIRISAFKLLLKAAVPFHEKHSPCLSSLSIRLSVSGSIMTHNEVFCVF